MKAFFNIVKWLIIIGIILHALALIIMVMPIVALVGAIGTWYYSKKKQDNKKRKNYLATLVIGSLGSALLIFILVLPEKTSITKPTPPATQLAETKQPPGTTMANDSSTKTEQEKVKISNDEDKQKVETETKQSEEQAKAEEETRYAAEAEAARLAQEEATILAAEGEATRLAQEQAASVETTSQQHAFSTPPIESAYYANCTEARQAGVTPLYAGDPGYSRKLDRDGDGIACE